MSKPLHLHDGTGTAIRLSNGDAILAYGTTAPAAGADGYAKGCIFIDTDSAAVYRNAGTNTSADFDVFIQGTQGAALTAADGGTVDTTYGQDEADVIANNVTRIGEIEAILVAAGLIAS